MGQANLFFAVKNGSVNFVAIRDENGEDEIIVRTGLTKEQAEALARRLNNEIVEVDQTPTTRREQKFHCHVEIDFDVIPYNDDDEFFTIKDIKEDVTDSVDSFGFVDGDTSAEKTKVVVTKVYDKQVPND